jgi:hypothetical protein
LDIISTLGDMLNWFRDDPKFLNAILDCINQLREKSNILEFKDGEVAKKVCYFKKIDKNNVGLGGFVVRATFGFGIVDNWNDEKSCSHFIRRKINYQQIENLHRNSVSKIFSSKTFKTYKKFLH